MSNDRQEYEHLIYNPHVLEFDLGDERMSVKDDDSGAEKKKIEKAPAGEEKVLSAGSLQKKKDDGDGQWVTIRGAHVFIEGGVITRGPKELVGERAGGLKEEFSDESVEEAKGAWDDDRTATAISRQSENLVKTGKASGENGRRAEVLLDQLGRTKAESRDLYRGLSSNDLKSVGELKKGSEFGITGLKSFTGAQDVAESYAHGSKSITVLNLAGRSRTLDLPDASVAGGERITNGTFRVTGVNVSSHWSDALDKDITVRTISISQKGIYGKKG